MALDIVISVVSKVVEYAVAPVARQIGYVINYKSNVENFKEQVNQLTGTRERVQRPVDAAKRNGDEIYQYVDTWLNRVTRITEEAEGFIVEEEDEAKKRCLNGWCPNLKSRYQLSKKAKKKMEAVVNLKGEGEAFVKDNGKAVSYRVPAPGIWSTSIEGYMALESRMPALKEIMEALTSSSLSVIGVYGMGGVGKTTLVEQVARKAREDKLFDQVVMATVKETPDVENIQTTIADKLGLKFDEGSQSGRADRLWHRLKEEEKILVILDDVFTALVLKEIGIPFGDDHKGCKLLLTSRYQDVLSREMGTQKDFRVEILLEEEAWSLFEKTVGDVVNDAKVRPVAIEVAKRCLGLPVLIVPVGKALRNGSLYDWKDTLKKLERFDNEEEMTAKVNSALELSYNHLKGKEIKSLFLLCGQLRPYFIPIEDLFKYSLGLGIFKKINSLEEARNRLHKLVNDLKASCLLLEGELPTIVKMHDFVHDFAISMASRDRHVFSVDGNSELKEWPPKDKLEQCTAISFPYPRIHELPEELQCPKVESFFLFSRDPSLKIPENFFQGMKKLKVLDLTDMHLLPLPLSLQYLENLRTLCLDSCVLGDIAALGELKNLEVLSLMDSNIVRLPTEIGKLTRLLLLDLSCCSKLEVISPGVLSSLSRLEDLYMGENSFVQWEIEESNSRRSNASLTELMNLPNLISLDIHIPDAKILPEEFFSKCKSLERYHILIGDELDWSGMNRTSRMFKLKLHLSFHMEYGVKMLLKKTEDLHLHELKAVENVLFELDGEGFPLLKHLSVQNGPEILYIINEGRLSCSAFPILESLILDKLINLEKICHGQLAVGSFAKLRSIKVESCRKLRYLFSISLASGLRQLQEIEVTECEIMEEIIAHEREDGANYNAAIDKIEFTLLRSLTLKHLPRLTRFSSIAKMPSSSQRGQNLLTSDTRSKEIVSEGELTAPAPLFNEKDGFRFLEYLNLFEVPEMQEIWPGQDGQTNLNLKVLKVHNCCNLRNVCSQSLALGLVRLQKMEVKNCPMIEEIMTTGVKEAGIDKILFPQLGSIILESLPNLTGFYSGTSILECPSLKSIFIVDCPNMNTFTITSLREQEPKMVGEGDEQRFGKGKFDITIAPFFNEKALLPNLEALELCSVNIEKIWDDQLPAISYCIQNLTSLTVKDCWSLRYVFTSCVVKSLVQLENLEIRECKIMEEIIVLEGSQEGWMNKMLFPKLEGLVLEALPKLTRFCTANFIEFLVLKELSIDNCPELKSFISNSTSAYIMASSEPEEMNLEEKLNTDIMPLFDEKVVFPNLEYLMVDGCGSSKCLFSTSMVGSLVKLQTLEICNCKFMEGVIVIEEEEGMIKMRFPKLARLKLNNLPKLTRFCFGNFIEFPTLNELWVENCPDLKTFISNSICTDIMASEEHEEMILHADKQAFFDDKVGLPGLKKLVIWSMNNVKKIWHDQLHSDSFCKLDTLSIYDCENLVNIFPSNILERLQRLELLIVADCGSLEEIIEHQRTQVRKTHTVAAPQLRKLFLRTLPNLKHVWSEDIQEVLAFQNLHSIEVIGCQRLEHLFPAFVARGLLQLEVFEIESCRMKEIVAKEKGVEAATSFVFPRVTSMKLWKLPELKCYYDGLHTSEWPMLKKLVVYGCDKVECFASNFSSFQEIHGESQLDIPVQQSLFLVGKVAFPNLEELRLELNDSMKEIWHGQFSAEYFCKLKVLGLIGFPKEFAIFPSCFLQELPNLEKVVVNNAFFKEIFPCERIYNEEKQSGTTLARLSELQLSELPELMHLWKEGVQGGPAFENLGTLEVSKCDGLKILVPSSISFQNLTILEVSKCHRLINLVTLSTTRSLVQLSRMIITECELMTEAIANDGSEAKDEIAFNQLKYLGLHCLPSLTSFCSGSYIFKFPSLEEVTVNQCPKLQIFSQGVLSTPKLQRVQLTEEGDKEHWVGNLNSTIQHLFNKMNVMISEED